jgi:hypothetical protein
LVVTFDEFSALVEEAGKNSAFVKNISQLAMRARKFGMTLVFAGQDFKADLLNTRITNQLKTRVQFRCARREQSAVVLGQGGAENITVQGRALVRLDGDIVECQTFWIDKTQVVGLAVDTLPVKPALTDGERALVVYAVKTLGGEFIIGKLEEAFRKKGWTNHKLRHLAQRWEHKGWLTSPQHATDSRKVTQELCALCGIPRG